MRMIWLHKSRRYHNIIRPCVERLWSTSLRTNKLGSESIINKSFTSLSGNTPTLQARKSSIVNILLFSFLASYLDGIIIPLPTLSRPEKGLQQKGKKEPSQRRLYSSAVLKVHENARNFGLGQTDRPFCLSDLAKKGNLQKNTHSSSSSSSSFYT